MEILFNQLTLIIITIAILVFSAIIHEVAHGYVAYRFGDPTAKLMGRLTLNPKSHIDPMMSVLLPLLLVISGSPVIFGGAKPVPIDPFNLKEGRKDVALVSLAGPLTNVIIAVAASFIFRLFFADYGFISLAFSQIPLTSFIDLIAFIVVQIVNLNVILAIFNLIPIPPLDGSKVFALLLPQRYAQAYLSLASIGIFILMFLLFFPIGGFSFQRFIFTLYAFSLSLLGF
ncbi:MAG: site-2 protease family protein [Candidatus Levybacteria bacterium]|nr:site-2 protease family protein [Candidatus Levybacteria bacterium]